MPKYEWYFVNKYDDVCKHVTYKITFTIYVSAHSNHLTLFTVLTIFLNECWLVVWGTKFCILKPCYCTGWFACNG